jgi:hypothetical protein
MKSTLDQITALLGGSRKPPVEGWCQIEKAHLLAATVFILRPAVTLEIGIWAGRSLIPMALAAKECGCGIVHGVDPYSPQASSEGYGKANADWWVKHADHAYAKTQFLGLIQEFGLQSIVEIHYAKSDEVTFPGIIDLLHIDGQHTEQSRRDVSRFGSKVRIGGICCMDDCHWSNDGVADVANAANDLLALGFIRLYGVYGNGNDCEFFQRVK